MNTDPSSNETSASRPTLGVGKALLLGHLIVNVPAALIILLITSIGVAVGLIFSIFTPGDTLLFRAIVIVFILIGGGLGWTRWSYTVPRWRKWALAKGASAETLQKWAVAS